jgi:hypothetical protein
MSAGVSGPFRDPSPTPVPSPDPYQPAPPEPTTPDSPEPPLPSYEDPPPINPVAHRMVRPSVRGRAVCGPPRVARAQSVH